MEDHTPEICDDDEQQTSLPGFRFHPTDEELVGFYLRRKVDMRPISLELIKQIDIYKHNPWDLPYASINVGDKEWYFFCKRGRKYKNSIRPNRVTGSGFWKATGIDKPVYSHGPGNHHHHHHHKPNDEYCIIGLKKTLVYYRGSAGKGTKTDWMMHEFRLPPHNNTSKNIASQEAEIWTLCRIFKRNVTYRRYASNWKQLPTSTSDKKNKISVVNPDESGGEISNFINFSCGGQTTMMSSVQITEKKAPIGPCYNDVVPNQWNSTYDPINIDNSTTITDLLTHSNWDELSQITHGIVLS